MPQKLAAATRWRRWEPLTCSINNYSDLSKDLHRLDPRLCSRLFLRMLLLHFPEFGYVASWTFKWSWRRKENSSLSRNRSQVTSLRLLISKRMRFSLDHVYKSIAHWGKASRKLSHAQFLLGGMCRYIKDLQHAAFPYAFRSTPKAAWWVPWIDRTVNIKEGFSVSLSRMLQDLIPFIKSLWFRNLLQDILPISH
jgi:hypothetical protein